MRRALSIAAALLPLTACYELGVYSCSDAEACGAGMCEPSGYCSYTDASCESQRRYGDFAGDGLAGTCVRPMAGSSGPSSSSAESSADGSDTLDTSGGAVAECGDASLDGDEQCDDGNDLPGDGCSPDCRLSGSFLWSIGVPGPQGGDDRGRAVVALGSGDVVAAGHDNVSGSDDRVITRRDADTGAEVWTWRREAEGADRVRTLTTNVVGDILAGGVEDGVPNSGSPTGTAWVGVFEPDGELRFEDRPPGNVVTASTRLAAGFVIAGITTEDGGEEFEGFAAAYFESSTSTNWYWTSEIPGGDIPVGVRQREGEEYVVFAGLEAGAGAWLVSASGRSDLGAFDAMVPQAGLVDRDTGDLIFAGYAEVDGFAHDARLGRWADDSAERWTVDARDLEGEVDEEFEAVALDLTGAVVVVGFRTGDDQDAWIRKYGPDGELVWTSSLQEPGHSIARAVDIDPEGFIVLSGEIEAADGTLDLWVAKLVP